MRSRFLLIPLLLALAAPGCVRRGTYEVALAESGVVPDRILESVAELIPAAG